MTPELQACVEMLERFRDTYLKNNAQEKIYINEAVEKARATDRSAPKAEKAEKAEKPASKKKVK